MEYKQSARSPHYGKIIAYDTQGRVIQELDVLRIKVVDNRKDEYEIGGLLEASIQNGHWITLHGEPNEKRITVLETQLLAAESKIAEQEQLIKDLTAVVKVINDRMNGSL